MNQKKNKRYWRSIDDLTQTPEFERKLHREWASEESDEIVVDGVSRRTFLGLMGASAALAGVGLEGCVRKPVQHILPYAERPEDLIPGNSRFFASVMQVAGHVQGVLVESQDGRPTKIEGNPTHPASQGRTTAFVQSEVLNLYDPDRSRGAVVNGVPTAPADALAGLGRLGPGTAILAPALPSSTFRALLARAQQSGAKVYVDDAALNRNQVEGLALAGAAGFTPVYDTSKAEILVALDSDFLNSGADSVANAAGFASRRGPGRTHGMNRLYAVEPFFTPTGATADNRYQIAASQIGPFAKALAGHILHGGGSAPGAEALTGSLEGSSSDARFNKWVEEVGKDLLAHRGESLVVVGERQPAWVHALGALINAALGNEGQTVRYMPTAMPEGGSLTELIAAIDGGQVQKLVILGGNPVHTTPGAVDFGAKMDAVAETIHLGFHYNETGRRAKVHVPEAHALEAWGDLTSADGTEAIAQPLIEPLYASYSAIQVLASMLGESNIDGRSLVQSHWRERSDALDFEGTWRRWLHDGAFNITPAAGAPSWSWAGIASALGPSSVNLPSGSVFEVVFGLDSRVYDGRYGNNPWQQELPDPISKLTWDNAAMINPLTARALGISFANSIDVSDGDWRESDENIPSTLYGGLEAQMITLKVGGQTMTLPAFVVPGVAENVVAIHVGYGREFGTVARGVGFRVEALRPDEATWFSQDVSVAKTSGRYALATTQDHGSLEGRPIYREATWDEYKGNPTFVRELDLHPPEELYSLWDVDELPRTEDGAVDPSATAVTIAPVGDPRAPGQQYWEKDQHQWGMSIDLSTCIGCNACTAACNAENNIAVVGKERVLEGREMHWIRLDRYFAGDPSNPEARMQPVACMHCENAPCEQVCPVAATTHGPQGTNDMAYNRCIGTRYCANNCPYKVRRFNYFNFSRENDDRNPLWRLQRNPNVTVRFRGVMEKCTYCIQRINEAVIEAKRTTPDARIPDGRLKTACEQACPTGAIVFGNVADPESRVSKLRARDRDYAMLSWLNSHPRTTYLAKLSNPNPELV